MKVLGQGLASILAAVVLVTQPGCGGSGDSGSPPGPSLTIIGLGWYEESIDPSFWTSPPPYGQTAFYDFWIHYSGEIAYGDILTARVYAPNGAYWTLNRNATFFSAANKTIGGWGRWYGSPPNLLPLGTMRAEVTLTNGQVATYSQVIPAPASAVVGSSTSMYSEDLLSPPPNSTPMIQRATMGAINTLTATSQTISIAFSVADSRVYSGFVWLYDAADSYLGGFFAFRDPWTGSIASQLGAALHTDGTANILTLGPADLLLNTGVTFGQIAKVRVVLTDGAQYAPQVDGHLRYDCRSVGPGTSLTLL
jgi:hypothetical protein